MRMTKSFLILTILGAFLLTPADALAGCKKKKKKKHKHHDDRSCHHDSRRYQDYDSYRSGYSAPRYYSPYRSDGYPGNCERRDSDYRRRSGFSITFN